MSTFNTCFFERYARITLESLLGRRFSSLLNKDRPDLQSPDGESIGIEVTRAMEESKDAAQSLLIDIAGLTEVEEDREDLERIVESGYGYGLQGSRYIGSKELDYWSMALPMRRILCSKIAKAGNGFYGNFDLLGLYVFSKDPMTDMEVISTMKYAMERQADQKIKYNRLYIAEAGALNACNLDDNVSDTYRIGKFPMTREQRREFFLTALGRQEPHGL